MRALMLSALSSILLAGCVANPVEVRDWPIGVAPSATDPNRLVALPPECGPVPRTTPEMSASSWHDPHLGIGCSQARNLGAQVAEPRDLLTGRPTGPADAEREARAVERYRKGEEKPLPRVGGTSFGSVATGGR